MRSRIKLLLVNVALAGFAAFLGALAMVPQDEAFTRAAIVAAGYAAIRAAIGLGAIYADQVSKELQAEVPPPVVVYERPSVVERPEEPA